jgi:hypothetical protein
VWSRVATPRDLASPIAGATDDDHPLERAAGRDHLVEQRDQHVVHDDDAVVGVVGDVGDLGGGKPQVERVGDRARQRDPEVGLEVLAVVPHQGRHAIALGDAGADQGPREPPRPLHHGAVGRAGQALVGPARHHLAVGHPALGAVDDQIDRQRNVHHRAGHRGRR